MPRFGEAVPAKAKACPHCGAGEKSGWGDDSADGLGLPEDDFDYEKFTAEEFGSYTKPGIKPIWKITAIVLLVVAALGLLISFGVFR